MNDRDHDDETVDYYLVGTGTWLDWLARIPRPVIAIGRKDLYSVMMKGQDFILPIEGSKDPVIGFYTTRFVAAKNIREAEKLAHQLVMQEWEKKGYDKLCGKRPSLSPEEVTILEERFRLRSGFGFSFYENDDSD